MIAPGMALQAVALWLTVSADTFRWWLAGSILLGLGTAMVYPALIAVVSDAAVPAWRARALGVYRFWRDLGYALGTLLSGILADVFGITWAIATVGALTLLSGMIVARVMADTRPTPATDPGLHPAISQTPSTWGNDDSARSRSAVPT